MVNNGCISVEKLSFHKILLIVEWVLRDFISYVTDNCSQKNDFSISSREHGVFIGTIRESCRTDVLMQALITKFYKQCKIKGKQELCL